MVATYHESDIRGNVFVAPMDAYGDSENHQNERQWKDRVVGGVTVCCSQCMSVLGLSTNPETFRLYKHRLDDPFHSCAQYIAHEIKRYAESEAVYNYLLISNDVGASKSILLRLVSWASGATTSLSQTSEVRRFVKVLYEDVPDGRSSQSTTTNPDDEGANVAPFAFLKDGSFCCPDHDTLPLSPDGIRPQMQPCVNAQLKMTIDPEEFDHVRSALDDARAFFPPSVHRATRAVKLGSADHSAQLSLLFLPM